MRWRSRVAHCGATAAFRNKRFRRPSVSRFAWEFCLNHRTKPVIGLTGGIGAGKSTVACILESIGVPVIDSDKVAHDLLRRADVVATLVLWWGERVRSRDGTADRRAVGNIVFGSPKELKRLEDLLYPRIAQHRDARVRELMAKPDVVAVAIDAPKLVEAGVDRLCDAVIFVDAPLEMRIQRVAESRGWTSEEVQRRENLQIPLDRKRALAEYTIDNHSTIEHLRKEVERVLALIMTSFTRKSSTSPQVGGV